MSRKKSDGSPPPTELSEARNGQGLYSPDCPPPVTCRVMFITPQMATDWMLNARYERQRDLYQPHVDELIYVLQQRQYSIQGIIRVKDGDTWHVTNGQHRLSAIAQSDIGTWEVVIEKDLNAVETAQEYSRTDQGKRRSVANALRAHGLGQEYDLSEPDIVRLAAAVKVIQAGFNYTKPEIRNRLHLTNQDVQIKEIEKWLPAGAKYFKAIREARAGRLRPLQLAATVAVGVTTCHYSPERAEEFWWKVAHEQNMELDDPAQALLGVFARRQEERAKAPVWARLVAGCWNAFYENRPLAQASSRGYDQPITLGGTPYKGRLTSSFLDPSNEP